MKTYIGIDPGAKGFITVRQPNGELEFFSIADHTPLELSDFLGRYKENSTCVMEEVHALFNSSAKSTFAFGEIFGLLKGIIISNEIPFVLIPPKTWQGDIWINSDKVYASSKVNPKTGKVTKVVDTKATSINSARRLFPRVDLRRTPACKNVDDNKCDSLLICEYARRKNL